MKATFDQKSDQNRDRKEPEADGKAILQNIRAYIPDIILTEREQVRGPLNSSIKNFYDCGLPTWNELISYIFKDFDFEEYRRKKKFEYYSKKIDKNKTIRESLLSFYDEVSKEISETDGFLVMRAKLEKVVNYYQLAVPSTEMLSSVKSMKGLKLLIERNIPSHLRFSKSAYEVKDY
ncbi:hypothetical protein DASC09_057900 [Saccharomycopsis crataegensis]|uniref:Uncharacterized protein n=1 Tax=Saccharomycopsis crataegensis TaxID=43959 RepID=A0AAV5QVB0_9ASCO|nr:hypothetical protein DASC09_057900 [Saccharomycopsis crataegensis]